MTAAVMLYSLLTAALVGLAGLAVEYIVTALGQPRRMVWIAAMIASILLPSLVLVAGATQGKSGNPDSSIQSAGLVPSAQPIAQTVQTSSDALSSLRWPVASRFDSLLQGMWLASSCVLIGFALVGWMRLRRQAHHWPVGNLNGVVVRFSETTGPAVFGFLRPQIVVPRWMRTAPRTTQSMALAHEQSHVAARDPLTSLAGFLVCALAPWNLPLWWQWRRLRFAIEVDCDRRVMREVADPLGYSKSLLAIGLRRSWAPTGAMAMIERKSQLERRVRIVLTAPGSKSRLLVAAAATATVSFVTMAANIEAPELRQPMEPIEHSSASIESSEPVRETSVASTVAELASIETRDLPARKAIPANLKLAQAPPRAPSNAVPLRPATPGGKEPPPVSPGPPTAPSPATPPVLANRAGELPNVVRDPTIKLQRTHFVAPVVPTVPAVSGRVAVDVVFTVGPDGRVEEAHEVSSRSDPVIDAAVESVRQWLYEPPLKDGKPTAARNIVRVLMQMPVSAQ